MAGLGPSVPVSDPNDAPQTSSLDAAGSRTNAKLRTSLLTLGTLACVCLAILVAASPTPQPDPEGAPLYSAADFARDPKVGDVFTGINVSPALRLQAKGKLLLVALGECESCTARSFRPGIVSGLDGVIKIGVFEGPARANDDRLAKLVTNFSAVLYLDQQAYAKLNALTPYRMYVIGRQGKLEAIQSPSQSAEDFLRSEFK